MYVLNFNQTSNPSFAMKYPHILLNMETNHGMKISDEKSTDTGTTTTQSGVSSKVSGVADDVFSMFSGSAKKDKKEEETDRGDISGSAKAQKDAAREENPEVCQKISKINDKMSSEYMTEIFV